jgi:hypothetical protein
MAAVHPTGKVSTQMKTRHTNLLLTRRWLHQRAMRLQGVPPEERDLPKPVRQHPQHRHHL